LFFYGRTIYNFYFSMVGQFTIPPLKPLFVFLWKDNLQFLFFNTSTITDYKIKYFLWKDNLQYQHSNPNLFSKQEQFTIFSNTSTIKENKRQFFYMGGQFTIIFLHASSIRKRGGRTSTSHNKQRKSCVNTSHDFMLAQITINKGY